MSLNPRIDAIDSRAGRGIVTLRPATPDDLELLQRWDREPHVVAGKGDDDWQWATELHKHPAWREFLIAEVDRRPIGFMQVIDPELEETQYWGCMDAGHRAIDIWIGEPDALGRGYGTQMMELAIERSFEDPTVTAILVDPLQSNTRAHRFYESLGFEYVVCRCFGEDRCSVYKLTRPDDTRGHA